MPDPTLGQSVGWLCPACGAMMYRARLLKGYGEAEFAADRLTCALHGPLGQFRHIATDRQPPSRGRSEREDDPGPKPERGRV